MLLMPTHGLKEEKETPKILLLLVMLTPITPIYPGLHFVFPNSRLLSSNSSGNLLLVNIALLLTHALKTEVVCVDDRVCVVDGKWTNEK